MYFYGVFNFAAVGVIRLMGGHLCTFFFAKIFFCYEISIQPFLTIFHFFQNAFASFVSVTIIIINRFNFNLSAFLMAAFTKHVPFPFRFSLTFKLANIPTFLTTKIRTNPL